MSEQIVPLEAQAKLAEVESLVSKLAGAEDQLERGYGRLAFLLKEVSENRYWESIYPSWSAYMDGLSEKWKVGRSSLNKYLMCAKALANDVTEDQLTQMGISKALVLKDFESKSNSELPANAVVEAVKPDVTAKDLRKLLFDAVNKPAPENETWVDLRFAFYVTDSEKQVLDAALNAARFVDPPISNDKSDVFQRKEIALRLAMEFLSTHSDKVVDGANGIDNG